MDIIDPQEKILYDTMALKEIVEFFKGQDKWFETCSTHLCSIVVSLAKYKEKRDPKEKIPETFLLLLVEINSFKEFLEKEKKNHSSSSSLRLTMVREAQDKMSAIEKQIHNCNLKVGSFAALLTKKFSNPKAADMWITNFYQEDQVSWATFILAFKKYALDSEQFELEDFQLENVVSAIDKDCDRLIRFDEWDHFYGLIWSNPIERTTLLGIPAKTIKKSKIEVPYIVLKMSKVNSDDPPEFIYPLKHEIFISEEKVVFQDYEKNEITITKNWEKEALIFGRITQKVKPDVYFHSLVTSVYDRQFQINLKSLEEKKEFFLNNLSTSVPTSLKIESIPYAVESDMIFELADTLLLIEDCFPAPNRKLEDDCPDYFHVYYNEKLDDPTGDEGTRKNSRAAVKKIQKDKKKKGKSLELPSITFKIIQGDSDKSFPFTVPNKNEEKVITIGSNDKCDFVLNEIEKVHLKFRFDPILATWFAERDEDCTSELKGNAGTYLFLINGTEYLAENNGDSKPKPGKLSVKLRDGMKIGFNHNELEVKIK